METAYGNVDRQKQGDGDDDGRRNDEQLATAARPENQEHRKQSKDTKTQETKLKQDHRTNQRTRNGITYRKFAALTFSHHGMVECAYHYYSARLVRSKFIGETVRLSGSG